MTKKRWKPVRPLFGRRMPKAAIGEMSSAVPKTTEFRERFSRASS